MAAVLDRTDCHLVAGVHPQLEFGDARLYIPGAVFGTSAGAVVVDYLRFGNFGCRVNFAGSVRTAPAFLKIRFSIGSRCRIEQQYRGLTACFEHALTSRPDE